MEFSKLGKHCSFKECKQLDFLPFECALCKKVFCLDHRTAKAHNCSFANSTKEVPICPICNQIIPISKGEEPNLIVDNHINKGCPKVQQINSKIYKCSLPQCKNSEFAPVICGDCHKNFCLLHRSPFDHDCIRLAQNNRNAQLLKSNNNTIASVTQKIQQRIKDLLSKSSSTSLTAKKVSLMKMKTQAKGNKNIPEDKKFYLEVNFPLETNLPPKLMFFNQSWKVGKILDLVADEGGIENRNNEANISKRLVLISLKNGHTLETSLALEDLGEVLKNGDSILLEYEYQ